MKPKSKVKGKEINPASSDLTRWHIVICLLLTFIAYLPVLKAGFVNWDDDSYVASNTAIRSFSNLKALINEPVQGNYHPLTMLSLALNYAISGLQPFSYHFFNLILHLANTVLVYIFALQLLSNLSTTSKPQPQTSNQFIALTTALLFGIHPMHVESVAWVSERKDVLYAFFFLLGLITYLKYLKAETGNNKQSPWLLLLIIAVLQTLSLASKPAAVIFPVVLFTIDFFLKRSFSLKLVIEKIPFFLLSAAAGYLTLHAQKQAGATDLALVFTLSNRILYGFYGYMMYFIKMILPLNLVAFHSLPANNLSLPFEYYIGPVFFIATAVLCFITWKKHRIITFAFAFYLVNLLLILQFFVVGSAVIAERYTYIPYISLFLLFGWWLVRNRKVSTAYFILAPVALILTAASYKQAETWQTSEALWDNAIRKEPSSQAYTNRATLLRKAGDREQALEYYNKAIKLNKADPEAWCNRGNIYFDKGMDSLALLNYNEALSINKNYVAALDNRGGLFSRQGKYEAGLVDISRAIEINPNYDNAYQNRALTYMSLKQYENAIRDFKKYLSFHPKDAEIHNAVGVCYQLLKQPALSIAHFDNAISLETRPSYYLNRSYAYNEMGKKEEARKDALMAKQNGANVPEDYLRKLGI